MVSNIVFSMLLQFCSEPYVKALLADAPYTTKQC
jgi:hypothetical protein